MKKLMFLFSSFLLVFIFSVNSSALLIEMGSGSSIDTSGTNSVLQLESYPNPNIGNYAFNLDEGESARFWFAKIYSNESWINDDDIIPGTINAYLDFDVPDEIGVIGGTSIGFSGYWKFIQGWKLTWNDPVLITFDGGQLSIELDDAYYKSGWWSGPDGSDCISATVTLASASNPVSEPGNMLLMGTALVGLAGVSRKKLFKK